MKLFEPNDRFIQMWNKVFPLFSIISLFVDPLFFYIPLVDGFQKCLQVDQSLKIVVCVLRSFVDVFYLLHILVRLTTEHPVGDPRHGAKGYLKSYRFPVDVLASLPLPQLAVLIIIPKLDPRSSSFLMTKLLKLVIFSQFLPRVIVLSSFLAPANGMVHLALYLFLVYVIASYVVGALWYLLALESQLSCWNIACERHKCDVKYLRSGEGGMRDYYWFLHASCPLLQCNEIKDSTDFDFGMFFDALQNHILETRNLPHKVWYCVWWGFQSLSSLGQDLKLSNSSGEMLFAYFITAIGLVLRTCILAAYSLLCRYWLAL